MLKKIFNVNILLFFVSTFLTLLFSEFLVRTFSPRHNIWDYKVPTIEEGWKSTSVPNTTFQHFDSEDEYSVEVKINKYGFRDSKDLSHSKEKDIVLLGDSFCFGYGVEEEERFGNILNQMIGDSIDVFNVSTPNCHFLTYYENLKYAKKLGLKTKRMIFGVCMENDILNYDEMSLPQPPQGWNHVKYWFHRNSSLYAFIGEKLHNSRILEKALHGLGLMNDNSVAVISTIQEQEIKSSAQHLAKIIEGYDELVLIIPSRYLWIEEHQAKALTVHKNFIQQLENKGINVLDMKPLIDEASDNPLHEIYFFNDGHWNLRGNQLVGEALSKSINFSKSVSQFE